MNLLRLETEARAVVDFLDELPGDFAPGHVAVEFVRAIADGRMPDSVREIAAIRAEMDAPDYRNTPEGSEP